MEVCECGIKNCLVSCVFKNLNDEDGDDGDNDMMMAMRRRGITTTALKRLYIFSAGTVEKDGIPK